VDPYFPKKISRPDGTTLTIVNELCKCGHFRTQHDAWMFQPTATTTQIQVFPGGHGRCVSDACSCGQFTWKGNVIGGLCEKSDAMMAGLVPIKDVWCQEFQDGACRLRKEIEQADAYSSKLSSRLMEVESNLKVLLAENHSLSQHIDVLQEKIDRMTINVTAVMVRERSILIDE